MNVFRRKGRLSLTQGVLVIAGVMFMMVMSLSSSINATLDSEFARRSYDMTITFQDLQRVDRTQQFVEEIPGVECTGMWLVQPVTILHGGQKAKDAGLGSQLQGVPLDDSMYTPFIISGRWLQPGDDHAIVMQRETAEDENIHIGDVVRLDMGEYGSQEWQVVGLYQAFLMFGGGFNVDAIYAPRPAVYAETHKVGRGSVLFVRTTDHSLAGVEQVVNRLEDLFQARNMDTATIETMPSTRRTADASFSMVIGMLLALALIVALVGGIGLMGSLWISVIERTREIGVMRAIGARSASIMSMFIMEGVVQGLISWIIAVPISLLVSPLMANALGVTIFQTPLEFQFNYTALLTWLAIILVIALIAAVIPARNATRINVRQSLSYE